MQEAVQWQLRYLQGDLHEGDVLLSNHPSAGGSHLPDLTVISPVSACWRYCTHFSSLYCHGYVYVCRLLGRLHPSISRGGREGWERGHFVNAL